MLKNYLKSLFENIYNPKVDPEQYISTFVSRNYKQVVDGHRIDYIDFIDHIKKQREIFESISFDFICLVEEGDTVASLHKVYAKKRNSEQEIVAEVHAFFKFKDKMLISCAERTRIIQGSDEDKDLGRRK
ncbi:nuclear transport factor 2 family protein [Francisella sp. SYW-9]|uniref:nuclear transport factor 2 family protein n=1 Tax=Francisella sp. SYW-9 TaxID=2610888 RepID=UPI00123C9E12|nr:nuclear transport factor 2 family protein [Francisella sp. SYW-9]